MHIASIWLLGKRFSENTKRVLIRCFSKNGFKQKGRINLPQ